MNAILSLLEKLNPNISKSVIYKIMEYVVLALLLVGLWEDATQSLSSAKASRDEQIKGYAVQIGVLHAENEALKEQITDLKADDENFRKWNRALSDRVNRLEDVAIKGRR